MSHARPTLSIYFVFSYHEPALNIFALLMNAYRNLYYTRRWLTKENHAKQITKYIFNFFIKISLSQLGALVCPLRSLTPSKTISLRRALGLIRTWLIQRRAAAHRRVLSGPPLTSPRHAPRAHVVRYARAIALAESTTRLSVTALGRGRFAIKRPAARPICWILSRRDRIRHELHRIRGECTRPFSDLPRAARPAATRDLPRAAVSTRNESA